VLRSVPGWVGSLPLRLRLVVALTALRAASATAILSDVWDTPWTSTRVGVVGHVYWVGARLTSGALDEHRGCSRTIPVLTASVEARSGALHGTLDGSLGYSDSDSSASGGARLLLGGRLWGTLDVDVDVGYRWERLDASAETNHVALMVHGPEGSVALRF
jgi:hypothetical protein